MSNSTQAVGQATPQSPISTNASSTRLTLSAAEFALAEIFERVSDARVMLEPAVANPDDHALVVVRTEGHGRDTLERALEADSTVAGVEAFGAYEEGWRYRVTWTGRARQVIQRLLTEDVMLLNAEGNSDRWKLRLLSPDRSALSHAYDASEEIGCTPECRSITSVDSGSEPSAYTPMTAQQYETLITAFEMGYYDIPRSATSDEVANHLGITHQALSERFRRAYENLVRTEFILK